MEKRQCLRCVDLEKHRRDRVSTGTTGKHVKFVTGKNLKKDQLRVLQWNADYLPSKITEFKQVLKEQRIDIFLVQETKMTQTDKPPSFAEYTILNAPRYQPKGSELTRGGGLMIGIHKSVDYREIKDKGDKGTKEMGLLNGRWWSFPWEETRNGGSQTYIYHQREEGTVETRVVNQ